MERAESTVHMKFLTRRVLPLAGLIACLAIIGQAFYIWDATGRRLFTQFHDPALIPAPPDELDALLTQAGAFDQGRAPDIDNAFRFGLLPSGFGRFALSVITVTIPALMCVPVCLLLMRTRSQEGEH